MSRSAAVEVSLAMAKERVQADASVTFCKRCRTLVEVLPPMTAGMAMFDHIRKVHKQTREGAGQ